VVLRRKIAQKAPHGSRRHTRTQAMGFQDRDYYREGSQSGYVTSMVVRLIIVNGIVYLADLFSGPQHLVNWWLALRADTIVHPLSWYQFLTAGFVHAPPESPAGFSHIFFNMLGLYCFGMPLEEKYGRREFLRFYLVAIVLGFIGWSASHYFLGNAGPNVMCYGASGGVTAVTLLFCLLYPRATLLAAFLFPVPAWIVGIVIVVSNLFGTMHSAGGVAYDVHLIGAGLALAYWRFRWNFGRLPGMDELRRLFRSPQRWFKPRPPIKVHDPEQYYDDLDAEADRLLEKVAQHGLSSLNDRERRTLEDYSRRTRQKLR
jgi:membrane associated rhomboid family serine protease